MQTTLEPSWRHALPRDHEHASLHLFILLREHNWDQENANVDRMSSESSVSSLSALELSFPSTSSEVKDCTYIAYLDGHVFLFLLCCLGCMFRFVAAKNDHGISPRLGQALTHILFLH